MEELSKYGLNEDAYEALLKDCSDKTQKITDMDWSEIVSKYDLGLHYDSVRKASQTILGGAFVSEYFKWKDSQKKVDDKEDEYFKNLRLEKQEIRKEKQKLFDERTALVKLLREQSRKESLIDIVKYAIENYHNEKFEYSYSPTISSDNDLIIHVTDVHCGVDIESMFNTFNIDVLKFRLHKYLNEIIDIQKTHNSKNAYCILGGDFIHGIIHVNARIEAKETVVNQLMLVSDIIGDFINELRHKFESVYVYTTPGNHGRVNASKEENAKGENFDFLIPYILKKDFKNVENVHIEENTLDDYIATFMVRGHQIFASHGDKDNPKNVVWNMTKFARKANIQLPDIIYLGHRHTNGLSTIDDVKVVESGCVDGMDNYAIDGRFVGTPEQTVTVVTCERRIKALYDIQLD